MVRGFDKRKVITDDYLVITLDYYFCGGSLVRKTIKGFIDSEGEIHDEGVPVWVGRKTAFTGFYGGGFMILSQQGMIALAKDKTIRPESKNVLAFLFGTLEFENFVQVPQAQIAEELEMPKQNVGRSIKQLEEKGILIRGPKVGRSSSWRLNPFYGFKGNPVGKIRKDVRSGHLRLVEPTAEEQ